MNAGYDDDRWIGCGCSHVNYTGMAWTIIISLVLFKILNPDCVGNVSDALVCIGDLLAVGSNTSCNSRCSRGFGL